MYRTHHCGELRLAHVGNNVILAGWVFRIRPFGGMIFIDLRDRYGITQLVFDEKMNPGLFGQAVELGREYVISASGKVRERSNKNIDLPTGDIEIEVNGFILLNSSEVPPFTLENETDGGDELRMKYRYLDLRRDAIKNNIIQRHRIAQEVRKFLNSKDFLEIETPFLIKSTPEGARDFVVPSRLNQGTFYALPQSPQTFKQLLMVSGFDKYYQIVRCFRDEDLRADRQPEFTQIDCEMSFVTRDDILDVFEKMIIQIFSKVKNIEISEIPRLSYSDAMNMYGTDKPDLRFAMEINNMTELVKNRDFQVFNTAEFICGIVIPDAATYTRKELDMLTDFVKKPQIGAGGLVWAKWNEDGTIKSSVDKFYSEDDLKQWFSFCHAKQNDLLLLLSGSKQKTLKSTGVLRLHLGNQLGLRKPDEYHVSWVIDFPMFEWDEEAGRFFAMHHPFTSPHADDIGLLDSSPERVRANAYDLVINGVEVGGGSVRISDRVLQKKIFSILGFTDEDAEQQFGFLLNAFRYGAPPHGGIAFGFDRLAALLGGEEIIRDFIAFPKNNQGRDVMLNAPSSISEIQLKELSIQLKPTDSK